MVLPVAVVHCSPLYPLSDKNELHQGMVAQYKNSVGLVIVVVVMMIMMVMMMMMMMMMIIFISSSSTLLPSVPPVR